MKKTPTFRDFKKVYEDAVTYPTVHHVSQKFGVGKDIIYRWKRNFEAKGQKVRDRKLRPPKNIQYDDAGPEIEATKLKHEIKNLKSELKDAQQQALTSTKLKYLIHEISGAKFQSVPRWAKRKSTPKDLHGIPSLFLSDIHFDEMVDPAQIGYVNEYDHDIAVRRLRTTFDTAQSILTEYVSKPRYDGITIFLGGDMVSGNIHEELSETNNAPILRSVVDLTDILKNGITMYREKFGKVFVPCVVGNHGRLHKKPRCKNRVFDNFEWLIYQYLAKAFKDDPDVTFLIPDGPDAVFDIYDKTFLLTHGDQFRGGSGISGIMTPLHMGLHKKQKKQAAIHTPFDVMALGHFHQYIHTNAMVVNGSVKGYDEFANLCNFPWEPPQQALFINHPQGGMIFRTPVLCDRIENFSKTSVKAFK